MKIVSNDAEQRSQNQNLTEAENREVIANKNFNFLQIEKSTLRDLRRLTSQSVPAAQVLMLLGEKMNKANAIVCSFKTLGEITKYSRSTLAMAVKLLEAERWIQIIKIGTANAYVVNSRVFWQGPGHLKRHASFHATILASETEQGDDYVENWENVKLRSFPMLSKKDKEHVIVANNDMSMPPDQQEMEL